MHHPIPRLQERARDVAAILLMASAVAIVSVAEAGPPVISGTPADSVVAGERYLFKPKASDPDGDALKFRIVNRPAWASFNSSTGRLSGRPGASRAGHYADIRISVSDSRRRVSLPAFAIEVQDEVTPPPPPPPPSGDDLAKLLNFAETWDRNWNFAGHSVTSAFTASQGNWDYTNSTYEPWLFDRVTVGHRLFELTGDPRWRAQFLADFAWYRTRIDGNGIFTPKGGGDTKYGYVTPFALYERLTGDSQYRPIAKRIYDAWVREWSPSFQPGGGAQLWTEREMGFALEAAVSWYEISGEAAALNRAAAIVQQWKTASGSVGAPLVTYTQHEGGGPGGTTPTSLTNSPWMSALYFQAARRYFEISNDSEVLLQASRYATWLDANGFYDAALAHPQYAGLVFPRYLTGALIGDAGYDYGNMGHCLDVAGLLKFALVAKTRRGESTNATRTRHTQMEACADADFAEWTRTTTYLPKYRINPPRKFNWQARGFYENAQ